MPVCPRFLPCLRRSCLSLMVGLLLATVPAVGQDKEDDGGGEIDAESQARIDKAQDADDLINLGKQFTLMRDFAAAATCVEKACALDPELLTDDKRQSPTLWSDFWFEQRASLREAKLDKRDAAGRVELARWLYDARVTSKARELLEAALAIDAKDKAALALAEEWHLFGGGPVRFDLGYALDNPLLLDTFKDEGKELTPRKDKAFLLVPIVYDPGDDKLVMNKTYLKAESDDGKRCSTKGIALLSSGGGARGGPQGSTSAGMRLNSGAPLYERVEIEQAEEGEGYELKCHNTAHPVVRATPGVSRSSTGGALGGARSGSSSRRDYGSGRSSRSSRSRSNSPSSSIRRPAGNPLSRRDADDKAVEGSGCLAFLVEVPATTKYVDCLYRTELEMRLDLGLLEVLRQPAEAFNESGGAALLDELAAQAASEDGAIASAVLTKLAALRSGRGQRGLARSDSASAEASRRKIDRALVTAQGHRDHDVRERAFDALLMSGELTPATADVIASCDAPEPLLIMLDGIEARLSGAGGEPAGDAGRGPANLVAKFGRPNQDAADVAVEALPDSPLAQNTALFAALGACLRSDHAKVRERALEIVLADATRQSVATLTGAPPEVRQAVVDRLGKVTDSDLAGALLRVLVAQCPRGQVGKLLQAARHIKVRISRDDDPLVALLGTELSGDTLLELLALLNRADLSELAESKSFGESAMKMLENLEEGSPIRAQVLKLILEQLRPRYSAPIPREAMRAAKGRTAPTTGFEPMLAAMAMDPKAEAATARAAAAALIATGRIESLQFEMRRSKDYDRCRDIMQSLTNDKQLQRLESLPIFLATCLELKDTRLVQQALASLALLLKSSDAKEAWRVRLAIKQGLPLGQLVELTTYADSRVAEQALALLQQVALLSPDETLAVAQGDGEAARLALVEEIWRGQSESPTGTFGCLVCMDVTPLRAAKELGARFSIPGQRSGVPLVATKVTMQRKGEDALQVLVDGKDIAPLPGGWPSINPAPLVRAALTSPDAEKEGLVGRVELLSSDQPVGCYMSYEQLGTWSAEIQGLEDLARAHGGDFPFRITYAKIIFEPLTR